jgi:hypothetical protein
MIFTLSSVVPGPFEVILGVMEADGNVGRGRDVRAKKEPPAIPSLPAAHKVLSFSPKQRTQVTYPTNPQKAKNRQICQIQNGVPVKPGLFATTVRAGPLPSGRFRREKKIPSALALQGRWRLH